MGVPTTTALGSQQLQSQPQAHLFNAFAMPPAAASPQQQPQQYQLQPSSTAPAPAGEGVPRVPSVRGIADLSATSAALASMGALVSEDDVDNDNRDIDGC
jgi:hypothetical protein